MPETGSLPRPIHLYRQGYKRSDTKNPDALCSQVATDRLVTFMCMDKTYVCG
jgi:hypothetical protein